MGTRWRKEIFGGFEAEVPTDWRYGTSCWPPCVRQPRGPYVGRPGGIPLVGCGISVPPLADRVSYLWFDSRREPGVRCFDAGWAEETRVVAGMPVTVLTDDDALRERLLGSVRPVADDTDCPARHPITANAEVRPDPMQAGLAGLGEVESVTVCRYAIGELADRLTARLPSPVLSMSRITGEAAKRLVRAIMAAPRGSGPNCGPGSMYGVEALVLIVRDGVRTQEVFVRYSGSDAHGFDDGRTRRWLTADALRPLLVGPHRPVHGVKVPVAKLVWPGKRWD